MKSYNEIANSIFECRTRYIEEKKKKRKSTVRCLTSVFCSFLLIAFSAIGLWQSDWLSSIISNEKAYPYEDKIQYLPKTIPPSQLENGFFIYNQMKAVDATAINLYAVLRDNSKLLRESVPGFADDGSVTFPQKPQTTER